MANTRTLQRSFNGGEITPEAYGHVDTPKYQNGLARCRNFIAKPHGPAENRAGFGFVRAAKNSSKQARLVSFTFSTTQTMAIEMGEGYFRFHTMGSTLLVGSPAAYNGATTYAIGDLVSSAGVNYYCIATTMGNAPPNATYWYAQPSTGEYEIPNPYAEADLFEINFTQSADVLTLVHPNPSPRELRRYGATDWRLSTILFAASVSAPSVSVSGNSKGNDYFYQYVVTSIGSDGISESAASNPAQGSAKNISGITNASPGVISFGSNHGLVVGNAVYVKDVGGMTELNNNYYVVGTVPSSSSLTLVDTAGNAIDTTSYTAYTSGGKLYSSGVKNNLFSSGGANTITWTPVAGATRYNVYKFQGGLYGYIGQTAGSSFVDDNISPDMSKTPPIYDTVFASSGNYPSAVSYFEQRRCFAGTTNQPQNIWMTKSGTEADMSYSLPIRDDDRIAFRVAAREANTIRHIVPLSQLLMLTSAAEWRVTSVNSDAITPTSISVKPQSYIGASPAQPVVVNNTCIYAAARGGHVRELGYNWQANGFVTGDLSLWAPHLFDSYGIADMAYSKAPQPVVWVVSTSGYLLGLTYVPEQQVGAWHWHDTDGVFESCCTVTENDEDVLYVVVRRTIDGQTKRYVERMESRQFTTLEDAFFVDSGLTYEGAPATTLSGLGHLEGKTVSILGDGAVHPQQTVTGGQITLEQAVSKAQIGLPITADLETLPATIALRDGSFGQARAKNVNKATLRVQSSSGVFIGPSADKLREYKQRTTEVYGAPPDLMSGEIEVVLDPAWAESGHVFVRQSDPLPLTLVSMSLEVALGG